jgi:dihydroxyacid dehydratase/phosphogluconate dehydratase
MEDFYYAGGLPAVLRALSEGGLLRGGALTVNGAAYRLLALPPGSPVEARDILRKAVMALNEDPDYAAEARRVMGDLPEYVSSPDLNEAVARGLSVKPDILKFMQEFGAKR